MYICNVIYVKVNCCKDELFCSVALNLVPFDGLNGWLLNELRTSLVKVRIVLLCRLGVGIPNIYI